MMNLEKFLEMELEEAVEYDFKKEDTEGKKLADKYGRYQTAHEIKEHLANYWADELSTDNNKNYCKFYTKLKEVLAEENYEEKLEILFCEYNGKLGKAIPRNLFKKHIETKAVNIFEYVELFKISLQGNETNINRFKRYKIPITKFDCDSSNGSSSLTNAIYQKLWEWDLRNHKDRSPSIFLKDNLGEKWNAYRIAADTMNSFSTTETQLGKISSTTKNPEITIANKELLEKFAGLTHSIGNFTLIPHFRNKTHSPLGFNLGRYGLTFDYWDLSLQVLKIELGNEDFMKYIDTFYMSDWVVEVNGEYVIKKLFSNSKRDEFFEKNSLDGFGKLEFFKPQDLEQLNTCLKNINCRIEKRGKRMVEELLKRL